jgi:hypothetical protein
MKRTSGGEPYNTLPQIIPPTDNFLLYLKNICGRLIIKWEFRVFSPAEEGLRLKSIL